jgi:photosystem II stability/assembly factor-like uncharacterized protein
MVMICRLSFCLLAWILFVLLVVPPVVADEFSARFDLARCGGSPPEGVAVSSVGGVLRCAIRSETATARVRLTFRTPLQTAGCERLLLEGRGEESTELSLCVSRVVLMDSSGKTAATYEPDLLFPPQWNLREVLLRDFEGTIPAAISAIDLHFWAPGERGNEYAFWLRRCELQSAGQVAAELRRAAGPGRPPLPVRAAPPDARQRWESLGPGGGGWYRVVAFSPHTGACFVGADVGGIYRSTDGCRTWQIVSEGIPNTYVNAFAFHPADPELVFAGCNGGVLRSTDGGTTWELRRQGFPPRMTFGLSAPVSAVAVDPRRPEVVFAGIGRERDYGVLGAETVGGRIYRSADGGMTWQPRTLPGGPDARRLSVFCIQFHPSEPETLYATTQGGLFRSRDGGDCWQAWGDGLDGYQTTFLAIRQDRPEVMLLGYSHGPQRRGGALKSTDGGASWTPSLDGLPAVDQAWRLVAHPRDPQTFYLGWHGRSGLFVTRDAGTRWEPLNQDHNIQSAWFYVGESVTGLDIDPTQPDRMVYCNDMDLYQTLDGGATWHQVATDCVRPATADQPATWRGRGCEVLCMTGPQALAVDPSNPNRLFFGYWDVHAWKSDDGGRTCYRLTDGIHAGYGRMGCVLLDPADPETVWLSVGANYDQHRLYQSVNGGKQFRLVGHEGSGLPPGGIFSLVLDPHSPIDGRVLFATVTGHGVYQSSDGGLSWKEVNQGLPADSRNPAQIALDPRHPGRLFLAGNAHYHRETRRRVPGYIARSGNGGQDWQIIKPRVEAQCVLIDPFDSRKVYVGNRNFSGIDYPQALYRSLDGGDTWSSIDQSQFLQGPGSLDGDRGARVNLTCLAADPSRPGVLYAACVDHGYDVDNGRGIFVSHDSGATWEPFPTAGLANYRVGTLVIDPTDPGRLYAGTGGNGLFRFGPPPPQALQASR